MFLLRIKNKELGENRLQLEYQSKQKAKNDVLGQAGSMKRAFLVCFLLLAHCGWHGLWPVGLG